LQSIIRSLPDAPGVYQYFDNLGKLLYVGKAKSLKKRVKSYWRFTPSLHPNPNQSPRILKMLSEAKGLEYLVVESEEDALILENSLIKQLKPKYNILLRDDKTYPYIYIDESEPFPRFEITRKVIKGKKITYYGPFPSGGRALLDALYDCYQLVQKRSCLNEKRACLFYQIKKCPAPCEGRITPKAYAETVQEAKEAIVKRTPLLERLQERMIHLATQERFEEAAKLRDSIEAIEALNLHSSIDMANGIDADIFAILNGDERGVIVKLFMRDGKIVSSTHTYFRQTHIFDHDEAYKQALLDFYSVDTPHNTGEILVADALSEPHLLEATLSERLGKKIQIHHPKRGAKAKLIQLAMQNATELLKQKPPQSIMEQRIADLLDLSTIPYRVETFDNSHMMGVATVGGMVVWSDGKWDKPSYRRYELDAKDEIGQMREMLSRRIADFTQNPPPDLWILDGGQANLNLAKRLLLDAGVNLDVIAIAKEKLDAKAHRAKGAAKDLLYTDNGIVELKPTDARLHWIQRQRDEAHRYAIAYHQKKKRKQDTQISLLQTKGVGPATVQKLLDYFGTFEAIYNASFETLKSVTSEAVAKRILENSPKNH